MQSATETKTAPALRAGTRIEFRVTQLNGTHVWEAATIAPWRKYMGRPDQLPAGYHPVKFAHGGILMVHQDGFRLAGSRSLAKGE